MSKDYKTRAHTHSRRKQKKSLPGYVWLLSGLAIGLFVAFIVYLDKQPENEQDFSSAVQQELEKLKKQAQNSSNKNTQKTASSSDKPQEKSTKIEQKFNFYTLLPELEILIPESETRPPETSNNSNAEAQSNRKNTNSDTTTTAKRYILQAGSFQNLTDAEKLKANLAFLGVSANIQHVTVNNQSWHRVRTATFKNKQQLYRSQSLLKRNNIPAIPMELK